MSNTQKIHLDYSTYKGINCGLRWDPAEEGAAIADLDLAYVTFDEYGDFISSASGKHGERIAEMGSLYHSGDDEDGADDLDDERISIDLLTLPRKIHYIFLLVEIHSNHVFGNIKNPHIRIAQTVTDKEIINLPINKKTGEKAKSYIFVRLDRKASGWDLNIADLHPYAEEEALPDWEKILPDYLPEIKDTTKGGADRPQKPNKGEMVPLYYKKQARHRIVCGIGWDPATAEQSTGEPFDLDLTCVLFDDNNEYYDFVTSVAEHNIDQSGAVYHTGDDESGEGAGDDEQVSVELAKLPPEVQHIFFIVESKSAHSLGEINNPHIRLADGMTNRDQLNVSLTDGNTHDACIFAQLIRENNNWGLHYIHEYLNGSFIEDWIQPLEKYLPKKA